MRIHRPSLDRAVRTFGAVVMASALASCASVPRGPAESLADAGIAATNAFSTDVRQTATQVRNVDVTDAFVATYDLCNINPNACSPMVQSDETNQQRLALVKVIELRAIAIDGLGNAYRSLKKESEYDARGELENATNSAIEGVNNFASAALAIGGAAPAASLITEPLAKITILGVGLFADAKQRNRIMKGSRAISSATKRLRDALAVEGFVFDSLAGYIEKNRTSAKIALLRAGLASNNEIILPLTLGLGLKPVSGVDAIIGKSQATQTAVQAVISAQSRNEVQAIRSKYKASIDALDALIDAHDDLEADRGVSLSDVERFLGELDVALGAEKKE